MAELDIRPFAGLLGAEVHGLDVASLDEATARQLQDALRDHLVIALPQLAPSLAELRDIGALFGELDTHPYLTPVDPEIPEVISLDSMYTVKADVWHTDATFKTDPPAIALLHMLDCPPHGGDTMFINAHAVYDSLSPALKHPRHPHVPPRRWRPGRQEGRAPGGSGPSGHRSAVAVRAQTVFAPDPPAVAPRVADAADVPLFVAGADPVLLPVALVARRCRALG